MLTWLFKKPAASPSTAAPAAAAPAAAPPAVAHTAPAVDWAAQLTTAQGDEQALLRLAQSAAPLATKLAAVQALQGEEALRQAEREFRSHDRKVHRLAKQRLEATVAQREARARARALLLQAQALVTDPQLPANWVAQMDRDWAALPAARLEAAHLSEFEALRARLTVVLREQADTLQIQQRWKAEAQRCLQQWPAELRLTAEQGSSADVFTLSQPLSELLQSRPDVPATARLAADLEQALQTAAWVQAQLAQPPSDETAPTPASNPATPSASSPAPAIDPALAGALKKRIAEQTRASQPAPAASPARAEPRATKPRTEAAGPEQLQQAEALLQQAESALAEGQLGAVQQHLQTLQPLLTRKHTSWPDALWARHQALWLEQARLKDWQQWGGARARDDLVAQAQALALQVAPAAAAIEPAAATESAEVAEASDTPETSAAGRPLRLPAAKAPRKLNLKALGDSIQALRLRWKAVDRQGAAATPRQWLAFDQALQVAHGPIAAQHAATQLARQENLAAREALLGTLEALVAPSEAPVTTASAASAASTVTDRRELQRQLFNFQAAWRKLGPTQHTAPAASRRGLEQRLQQAVARLEAPLRAQQDAAVAERERLIRLAQACLPGEGAASHADAARQVRELQADWQHQARGLPLPRGLENALWTRFKAATDAVFEQREAALGARDAERAAHLAAAEALVQRLVAAGTDLALDDIGRTLTEVDRAWRQGGALPPGTVDALQVRYRSAHAAAVQRQSDGQRLQWQAQCDALAARLRQCEAWEDAGARLAPAADEAGSETAPTAADQNPLPRAWEQPLAQRRSRAVGSGPLPASDVDDLLLRLEIHLNLPAAPEWQASRQQLKLRALKDAMEGSQPPAHAQPAEGLRAALMQAGLSPVQRQRLQVLVAALRERISRDFP